MEKHPAVYIMANRYRGTLYIGVTSDLFGRVSGHKNGTFGGFTERYDVKSLVWYAHYSDMQAAIRRENQIKAWKRQWKIAMIEKMNPDWRDLHESIDATRNFNETEAGPQLSLG